jgi:hypothetical protein
VLIRYKGALPVPRSLEIMIKHRKGKGLFRDGAALPSHEHICRELTVLVPVGMLPSHMRAGLPAPKQSGSQGLPEAGFRCPRW